MADSVISKIPNIDLQSFSSNYDANKDGSVDKSEGELAKGHFAVLNVDGVVLELNKADIEGLKKPSANQKKLLDALKSPDGVTNPGSALVRAGSKLRAEAQKNPVRLDQAKPFYEYAFAMAEAAGATTQKFAQNALWNLAAIEKDQGQFERCAELMAKLAQVVDKFDPISCRQFFCGRCHSPEHEHCDPASCR